MGRDRYVGGRGWGSFAKLGMIGHGEMLGYPHNIFAEAWYEHGIIATCIIIYICLYSFVKSLNRARAVPSIGRILMLSTIVFVITTSSISGDLYSNKFELSVIMIGYCISNTLNSGVSLKET